MPTKILMPALSPTMEEGTLAKWHVSEGETVAAGDVIAEIETDKATMEVEAVDEGAIGKILVSEGTENVAVNEMIAVLLEEGEDSAAIDDFLNNADTPGTQDKGEEDAETTKSKDQEQGAESKQVSGGQESAGNISPSAVAEQTAAPMPAHMNDGNDKQGDRGRVFASPLARRLAEQNNLPLAGINGSGPRGRIVKADIERAQDRGLDRPAAAMDTEAPQQTQHTFAPAAGGVDARGLADKLGMEYETLPNSGMRKTIAKRLLESKQTVPHYYLSIECRIDALLEARKRINDQADGAFKLSVNDFLIKACAMALHAYPRANVAWTEEAILQFTHADISVAVATDNGLITPIIKRAETKGLRDISGEIKDMAARAREGKLKPEEYQGGTFSLSNLGMYGIDQFSAIINPPQSCIFAVGAGVEKPYVDKGDVKVGTFMTGTLSCDHRSVDGAVGAEYLRILKSYIENPVQMLV